jgi:alpha/beta superfamily hydrolase
MLLVAGCSGGDDEDGADATDTPRGTAAVTRTAEATGTPVNTPTPPPAGSIADEPVAFENADGVTLRGHLYSIAGPKRRVTIFVHDQGSNQAALKAAAQGVVASGVAALTFDFAGAGESTGTADIGKWERDLQLAFGFAKSRDFPLVYLVGAGTGGTAALKVAAKADTSGVVTLSAPVNEGALDARPDLAAITEPKLFIAARNDGVYAAAVGTFFDFTSQPKQNLIMEGSNAHGAALLSGESGATVLRVIREFVGAN